MDGSREPQEGLRHGCEGQIEGAPCLPKTKKRASRGKAAWGIGEWPRGSKARDRTGKKGSLAALGPSLSSVGPRDLGK